MQNVFRDCQEVQNSCNIDSVSGRKADKADSKEISYLAKTFCRQWKYKMFVKKARRLNFIFLNITSMVIWRKD